MKNEMVIRLKSLKRWNSAYRNGEPLVDDSVYDYELNKFKQAYPRHPFVVNIEPVNWDEDSKQTLPVNMRSMDKVKSIKEILAWAKKRKLSYDTLIHLGGKLDGLSLLEDQRNKACWTRGGDKNKGFRRDKHLQLINPNEFPYGRFTGGEVIISRANWKKFWENTVNIKTGEAYKTQRGTMSGLMRSVTPDQLMIYVDYIKYYSPELEYGDYTDMIDKLNESNKVKLPGKIVKLRDITEKLLLDLYEEWNTNYEIDGIILNIVDGVTRRRLGRSKKSGNPNYAVAYKGDFEEKLQTKVKSVTCKVSKQRFLKPTVQLKSVILSGAEVQNPTGYNMKWIFDNNIAEGSEVIVKRSGEVIPKIVGTVSYDKNQVEALADHFAECPACGSPTTWNESHTELCCVNSKCSGVKLAKLVAFFEILGFEDFGENTIEKLFNTGFDTIDSICNIQKESILAIDGLGESTFSNLITQIEKRREQPLAILMHASSCFLGLGSTKLQLIIDSLGDMEMCECIANADYPESKIFALSKVKGLGDKTIELFWDGIDAYADWEFENDMFEVSHISTPKAEIIGDKYKDCTVCFSGIRDKDLEEEIKKQGGVIVSGVSKKTTHLVVADVTATTSKITKANKLGCSILTLSDFKLL